MKEEIDHKALISSLSAETRRDLCAQADVPGILHLGFHLGAILCIGIAIATGLPGWQLLLVPQGVLLVFLFTTLHETTHRTAFATDWMNVWTARLCAFLVLLGPDHFRYFHMAHHRFTHDPENDPELAAPKPRTVRDYLIYMTGVPEWIWRVKTLVRNAAGLNRDVFVPPRGQSRVRTEAQVALGIYALLLVSLGDVLVWVWLIPMLLGAPFMRAYLLAEHTFCPHVSNMLANTRTTFTNRLVRWLAWNMPYHAEHHAYPAVPFHRLPRFHALTRAHLKETQRGYADFATSYPARARNLAGHGEPDASEPRFSA